MKEIDVLALRKLGVFSRDTKIGKVRSILGEIEKLISMGVPLQKIVDELNEQAIEINLATFKMILFRLRKERDRDNGICSLKEKLLK